MQWLLLITVCRGILREVFLVPALEDKCIVNLQEAPTYCTEVLSQKSLILDDRHTHFD